MYVCTNTARQALCFSKDQSLVNKASENAGVLTKTVFIVRHKGKNTTQL